jgi:hypothetical protein
VLNAVGRNVPQRPAQFRSRIRAVLVAFARPSERFRLKSRVV